MQAHDSKLVQMETLRTLVAEKFPQAPRRLESRLRIGCKAFDQKGGFLRGAVTEVCGSSAGGSLLLAAMADAAVRDGLFIGLIDASNSFEPADWTDEHLRRILWVMGGAAAPAIRAADILLRDGNLPVVILDLQMLPMPQLRRIPASAWHRFRRVIEPTATVLTVLTPQPMVEGAAARMAIRTKLTLDAMHLPRPALWEDLDVQVFERSNSAPLEVFQKSA
ncbi:MAG TPA: hypothetical protein VIS96_19450 [Terrimicrobiaceae bacterium]